MTQQKGASPGRKLGKALKIAGIAVAGVVLALVILLAWVSPLSHKWVLKALRDHYHTDVQLKGFEVSLFPRIRIAGEGLVLRDPSRPGAPPLVSVNKFTARTSWLALLRHPTRVNYLRLSGLRINIPPRQHQQTQKKPRKRK
ncbi:MAG: AsmA family protein, partial [Terriglobia bacterium]